MASNGVPPSISKRVLLRVQCKSQKKLHSLILDSITIHTYPIAKVLSPFFVGFARKCSHYFIVLFSVYCQCENMFVCFFFFLFSFCYFGFVLNLDFQNAQYKLYTVKNENHPHECTNKCDAEIHKMKPKPKTGTHIQKKHIQHYTESSSSSI